MLNNSDSAVTERRVFAASAAVEPTWTNGIEEKIDGEALAPRYDGPTEAELLKRAKNGDDWCFGELSERSRPALTRTAYRMLRNGFDAQDAVQDALLCAFRNLTKFQEHSAFATWATRITINCCLMKLRNRQARRERYTDAEMLGEGFFEIAGVTPDPEWIYLRKEEKELLKAEIATLPEKLRGVIELNALREFKVEKVAAEVGTSVSSAKARLCRARSMLRKRLEIKLADRRVRKTVRWRAQLSVRPGPGKYTVTRPS